jgi:hypothetical protein
VPKTHSGGSAGLLLPPLVVILLGSVLGLLAFRSDWKSRIGPAPTMRSFQQEPAADTSRPDRMLSPVFRPEVLFWADAIVAWAAAAGVDPDLAAVVMQIESCGDPGATSRSGAMGLFQVMPFHFASSELPYDPETNALRGLGYLARSLEASGGDARLALAGYNGGIGVINWDEQAWSQQTQRYVRYGASIYADIQSGRERSPALEEWYAGFGVNLCRAAADRLGIQP